jgi:hypothetical protein
MEENKDIEKKEMIASKSKEKEYVKNYNKEYYEKTREARLNDMKQIVTCDVCNCNITKGKMTLHKKSNKHKYNELSKSMLRK